MKIMLISVVINIVLDPILIFGFGPVPGLEVAGAAIATVISRGVATLLGIYVLFGSVAGPSVELSHLVPDPGFIWRIFKIGTPTALESSTTALALITLTAMAVTFAPPVVAAYGLVNRLASLVYLPAMGLGRATNTMVGQNLGARKPDRAEEVVWLAAKVGTGVMIVGRNFFCARSTFG